jgi:magnesium transporter
MITRHTHSGITWIDLESPTREELQGVISEFKIDSRIEEEIVSPTPYPLVVDTSEYVYLVLHFPTNDPNGGAKNQEIDFIVGKDFLITCRYELITSIHNLHKVFEAEELLGIKGRKASAGELLERILRQMYSAITQEVEQFARMLERIEEEIFTDHEHENVRTISLVGRVLLRFDTTLVRHQEPLQEFLHQLTSPSFFGKAFEEHASHIEAEHNHTATVVASYREVAAELRETNASLLSMKQNDITQRLTIMAFITFPLTLIAALFSMDTRDTPLVGSPHDFWLVIALMAAIMSIFFIYFKRQKWL